MAKKVIIIGAGIAGISASIELINSGFEVHLVEQKNEIGGRVSSIYDKFSDEIIDNGQHLLIGAYHNFINFVEQIKSKKYLEEQKSLTVTFLDNFLNKDVLNSSINKGKLGVIIGLFNLKYINFEDKINLLIFFLKLQLNLCRTENKNCLEFLKSQSQSELVIIRFWQPLILAILNSQPENASAELLVLSLKKAFFSDSNNSKLIFPIVNLNELLVNFIEIFVKLGGQLHLNKKIGKLVIENNTAIGIEINGEIIEADYIISAIPPHSLIKLLDNNILENQFSYLKEFSYSPIISAYFWFDKPIMEEKFLATIGTKTQWIFNRRKILHKANYKFAESISVTISNADEIKLLNNNDIAKLIYEELLSLLNIDKSTKLLHSRVIKEMMATISISPKIEKIRPNSRTKINNFFLAGDWTNTKLPATIESACLSGIFVAKEIGIVL